MSEKSPCYRRILLKLSGEALMGEGTFGIEPGELRRLASEISRVHQMGVQLGVVLGGGNIFRGLQAASYGVGRVVADQIGMLATVINALAFAEALKGSHCETRVMTAIDMNGIAEPYIPARAISHLEKRRVVLFAAGTGNPYFTTDTAAALRALEIEAEILLKGTKVDGVYDADPQKDRSATWFPEMTYPEVLERKLKVMDLTAVSLAMGQGMPIVVFNLRREGNLLDIVCGDKIGTLIRGVDA
jgi:uridylate kinase